MHTIITIGRQHGSGGAQIGRTLAGMMGIPFYDKEALRDCAVHSGLGKLYADTYGEKHAGSLLFSLSTGAFSFGYYDDAKSGTIGQKAYLTAFETIKEVAKRGPCVIVGRCADYVLRENAACVSFFIHAPLAERTAAISGRFGLSAGEAERRVHERDRLRRSYYNYYTRKNWGEVDSYHLSIDSSRLGAEGAASLMEQAVRMCEHRSLIQTGSRL